MNKKEINDQLELIEDNAKFLLGFIEGLTAAATLQGLSKDEVYNVSKFYGTASNIRCYCSAIRDLIKEKGAKK